jgi:hypothetical protein
LIALSGGSVRVLGIVFVAIAVLALAVRERDDGYTAAA